jgi:hypothetical protein
VVITASYNKCHRLRYIGDLQRTVYKVSMDVPVVISTPPSKMHNLAGTGARGRGVKGVIKHGELTLAAQPSFSLALGTGERGRG